jgi:hypothetical protein
MKHKNELFNSIDTPYGALVTKSNMKGLYILVVITDEYKGSISNAEVQRHWGDYVANTLEGEWKGIAGYYKGFVPGENKK